jgi:hypothetical protein
MRKKELEKTHGKLNKSELCPLCADPEFNCKCLKSLSKSETPAEKVAREKDHAKAIEVSNDPRGKPVSLKNGRPQSHPINSPGNPVKKDEMDGGSNSMEMSEEHLDKAAMASSSASALAPKPEPMTAPAHVNKELGGFKSIASKPPIASMGRNKASASGAFTTIKSELKATKTPKGKANPGSGGETKKGPALKKSAIPSVKQPAAVGTAGKQPVGLGGGDANKLTSSPHPDAKAAPAGVKGSGSTGQWKGQGLPQLQQSLAAVRGGVSWLKSTHAKASRVHPAQAAPKSQRFHGALPLQRSEKDPAKNSPKVPNQSRTR